MCVYICVYGERAGAGIGESRDSVLTCRSLVHVGGRSISDVLSKLPVKMLRAHLLSRRLVYKPNIILRNMILIHSRRTRQRAKRRHYALAAAGSVANLFTSPDLDIYWI